MSPILAPQFPSCLKNMAACQTLQPSLSQTVGPAIQILTMSGHMTPTNRNHDMPAVLVGMKEPESSGPSSESPILLHTFQNSTK